MKNQLNDDEIKNMYLRALKNLEIAYEEAEQGDIGREGAIVWLLETMYSDVELNR